MGGTFETVDLNPEATHRVQTALEQGYPHLLDRINCHTQDSVEFIRHINGPFDIVYLDSYDLYPGIFKESEAHGLLEFNGVIDKLSDSALILIDDTPRTREIFRRMNDAIFMTAVDEHFATHTHLPGKGSLVLKQIANDPRFTVLHHEYQLLLKFKR
jgi:predicted O-methyltransferase YrrM